MQTLLLILSVVFAETYPRYGRVVSVYDGDTYTLADGNKIRLRGVNTPELKPAEDYGVEARDAVRDLILGKEVKISYGTVKVDGYGRLIASVESKEGKDVATELLRLGYGHIFLIPPDTLETTEMFKAQMQAKAEPKLAAGSRCKTQTQASKGSRVQRPSVTPQQLPRLRRLCPGPCH